MAEEFIGLDVGMVRTGFARGSAIARLAEPLFTVPTAEAILKLRELAKELSVKSVVVGLPRNMQGEDTNQTAWVRQWVDKAKKETDLVFYWQDEALTSKIAEGRKLNGKEKTDIDALAASIIMQDFLDTPEADRVVC